MTKCCSMFFLRKKHSSEQRGLKMNDFSLESLHASEHHKLHDYLQTLPKSKWNHQTKSGHNLIHFASVGDNAKAIVELFQIGVKVSEYPFNPIFRAVIHVQPRVIQVLCVIAPHLMNIIDIIEAKTPLEVSLTFLKQYFPRVRQENNNQCIQILLSNGVRLSSVRDEYAKNCITPKIRAFENGILSCRRATIALLRVKRAGNLLNWDKFLLAQLALDVWITRCEWIKFFYQQ